MIRMAITAAVLAFTAPAIAQQQPPPDPVFLSHALIALQAQRNSALDAQAVAEARAAILTSDMAKLQAKLDELTKPKAPPVEPPK